MEKKYRLALIVYIFFISLFCMQTNADAKETVINSLKVGSFKFTYHEISTKAIWITRVDILSNSKIDTLKIPTQIEGKNVIKLGNVNDDEADVPADNLFGMHIDEDAEIGEPLSIIPKTVRYKVANIKRIILPVTLKELTPQCFHFLQDGKSIHIPKDLTKNVLRLGGSSGIRWKKVSISSQNRKYKVKNGLLLSKNGKTVYAYVGPQKRVVIPEGVKIIAENSFWFSPIKSVRIPKTVCKIEQEAFLNSRAVIFKVAKKNENYALGKKCIYSKRSKRLVVAVENFGIINVPNQVTCLKEGISFVGGTVKKIIFPSSLKKIGKYWNSSLSSRGNMVLIFKGDKPPQIDKIDVHFPTDVRVYVPKGRKAVYKKAFSEWGDEIELKE